MRKIGMAVCISSALLMSPVANAGWDGNWLIGVSAGYGDRDGDLQISFFDPPVGTIAPREVTIDHNDSGFIWGFLGGYQAKCNGWLFGAEVNVDWHDFDDEVGISFTDLSAPSDQWSGTARYRRDTVVGLTLRAGYEVTPYLMPYIRLGAETSDDEISFSLADQTVPVLPLFANTEASNRQYRFLGGIGIEMPIPWVDGMTARAEYNYHSKGSIVDAKAFANDNLSYVEVGEKNRTHSGKASLVWNFL